MQSTITLYRPATGSALQLTLAPMTTSEFDSFLDIRFPDWILLSIIV